MMSQNPFGMDGRGSDTNHSPRSFVNPEGLASPLLSNINWEVSSNADHPNLNLDRYDSFNMGQLSNDQPKN
jgi:hypothetical protein